MIQKAIAPIVIPVELHRQELIVSADGHFTGDASWTVEAITNILKNCMERTPNDVGLALASTIITSQNGIIKAENRSDGGSKFTIRFYKGTV